MRQVLVVSVVVIPLVLSVVLIVNGVVSDTFPMFREIPMNESQYLQQTYQAGLEH
ncbi:MAG: hypothetical protein OEL82_02935 [Nitrosopumilus sp.]|nr:hypothetical protein [Nitrosopumilus sp.]